MKNVLKIGICLIAGILGVLTITGTSLSDARFSVNLPITNNLFRTASFSFNMNGVDSVDPLQIDLGTIIPGQSGRVDITITNTGSKSAKLSVTTGDIPSGLVISNSDTSDVTIEPNSSTVFSVDWVLPAEVHETGLDGPFQLSFTFIFEGGFSVTKEVILNGVIFDPTNTPTITETPTETATLTATATETVTPTETATAEVVQGLLIQVDTETLTPTLTSTEIPTVTPTDTVEPTFTSTNTPEPTFTSTSTPVPTEVVVTTEAIIASETVEVVP
jgi:hypothetical protein